MIPQSATFILSAPTFNDCPSETLPEVCFAGRSNVGKSSMINAVVNRKKLVKTSNMPGKTRGFNYFKMDEKWFLVDLPGYGYAKVSKSEREKWDKEAQKFYTQRTSLRLILLIVDSRHDPGVLDTDQIFWLAENQLPFAILLSKADKLTNNQKVATLARMKRLLKNMNIETPIILTSAETKQGIEDVRALIDDFINENYDIS
ncbi:MAG TPA: YihA family ribosome biogenesis GTP-binding protein [Bacteroidetes bacterium]|nr:YihA family ribosome biogenesis GTP-binding protein [Bacteroidota bacterium]